MKRIRVLALASYPVEAASSRYRIVQFIEPLARRGIDVTFSPFLDSKLFAALYEPGKLLRQLPRLAWRTLRRFAAVTTTADVVFVQREAMLFGPPLIEWLLRRRPMILDLDDATWVAYRSPVYGRLATLLKWPAKTDRLIRWACAVTCGSPHIAAYANGVVVPTVVDTKRFRPREMRTVNTLTIGWIGTHGTYPYLEKLLPLLDRLDVPFRLLIIGSGREQIAGAEVRPWRLEREVEDFHELDIGLYPLDDDDWSAGKAGFKAVQYMAAGVPFVMSPVGVCATMGIAGETHLLARTDDEWLAALQRLATDGALRDRISAAGRQFAVEHFDFEPQADALAAVIRKCI